MSDFSIDPEVVDITVAGERISERVYEQLTIVDVGEEMDVVAARMSWWGAVWAAAEAESEQIDSQYRSWRAGMTEAVLSKEPKLAEWKVKAALESEPDFMKFKNALALATRNKFRLRTIYQSFETKARLLQSKGAIARTELDKTGITTTRRVSGSTDSTSDASVEDKHVDRTQRLKDRMKRKKKKRETETEEAEE